MDAEFDMDYEESEATVQSYVVKLIERLDEYFQELEDNNEEPDLATMKYDVQEIIFQVKDELV